jgi:PAS domain S-box-containing protein
MFGAAFRDSLDSIIVIDAASGEIIECNRAVRACLGWDPEQLVGRRLAVVYAPAESEQSLPERVRLHGAVVEERELIRIDGSVYPMHLRAALSLSGTREVIIVTLRDVRDRRDAEAARRSAEAKYQSIFEHTVEGIFQTTPDGRYLSANPSLARIYGYESTEELIERLTDIAGQLYVDPTRRAAFRRLLEEDDVVRDFESQVRRKDGTVTWISENARAVRGANGRICYYEGTVVDVSTRKRAEEAREQEGQVAYALAYVGHEMIASLGSTAVLERLSELAAEVLSCDRTHLWIWDSPADGYVPVPTGHGQASEPTAVLPRAGLVPLLERLARDEVAVLDSTESEALPPVLRDLQSGYSEGLYFAIRRGGVAVGVLAALHHRQAEPFTSAQLRIARGVANLTSLALEHARVVDELERANRLKSEFVATISHEFRTPINIMLGYNEMLRDEGSSQLSGVQTDLLERLERTTRSLAGLVDATLDLSRLDAGKLPVDLGAVDVAAFTRQLEDATRDLLVAKPHLELRWHVSEPLPVVYTDPAKLTIVLKNLIGNAVKFTERGTITVSAAPRLRGVEFVVADTGPGIAEDALSYVFEAFRQGDASPTRRHDGVGLGLHLVKRLVTVLGGTVDVTSTLGAGSTFRVWLPPRP